MKIIPTIYKIPFKDNKENVIYKAILQTAKYSN